MLEEEQQGSQTACAVCSCMTRGVCDEQVCLMDGIYILHTMETPMRWQRVDVKGVRKGARAQDLQEQSNDASRGARTPEVQEPSPRGAHGFGYINGKLVVFGGYGPPNGSNGTFMFRKLDADLVSPFPGSHALPVTRCTCCR